ncbi:SMP-30/gluconolactonase/LRE family protein [Paenibacillus sp. LMG 31458]|uniref:SMP-30/gluconolactonase/LRE family protein n=1 Tax=Paenibacillus phytorum TaxID=2654977 RepID=A0ABX1Y2T2_9BACL|nr:SMP-30/gluconolactonase/LRE family protein [Paenibacillus phytorum]NOU75071.1 SMP-30/gluconolactonase/LRE family protein [Paenibacillus phytorum]
MTHNLKIVHSQIAELAEGPCWDVDGKLLYWVDIPAGKIHILNLETRVEKMIAIGQQVGAIALRKSGGAILAAQHGFYFLDLDTEKLVHLADPEAHLPDNRFNDGKCDARGRFWAGTMSMNGKKEEGSLYCMDPNMTVRKMLGNVSVSNGISWSPNNRIMYYIDSMTKQVNAFDYELETGEISNPRVVVQIPEGQGIPDGMTTDTEGMLWIALWGGYKVSRWNPMNGSLLDEIKVPAAQVTSCVFGGETLDQLFITSAWQGLNQQQKLEQPYAGAIFSVQLKVKGMPFHKFG